MVITMAKRQKANGVQIKLVHSLIGRKKDQIATAQSLGLRKIGDCVSQPDNRSHQRQSGENYPPRRGNRGVSNRARRCEHYEVTRARSGSRFGPGSQAYRPRTWLRPGKQARAWEARRRGPAAACVRALKAARCRCSAVSRREALSTFSRPGMPPSTCRRWKRLTTAPLSDLEAMQAAGIVKKAYDGVKVLGNGSLTKNVTVKAAAFSEVSAKAKIEAAGGRQR